MELTRDEDSSVQVATGLANRVLAEGGSPGSTVIDNFPFLSKLPSWIVRSEALRHARKWGWIIRHLHDTPFSASKRHFVFLHNTLRKSWANFLSRKMEPCSTIRLRILF
jgi:hypothetical protein